MTVRPAAPMDVSSLARLRWQCRAEAGSVTEMATRFLPRCERWMAERLSDRDRWRCWIAIEDGRPVGCIWLELFGKVPNPASEPEEHAYVTALYVVPDARQAGLGGALLDEAVGECRRRGLDCAVLWSTPESRSLYRRRGFATDAELLVLRGVAAPIPPASSPEDPRE
jgi:GNAT superfamily N-acetyltransferase